MLDVSSVGARSSNDLHRAPRSMVGPATLAQGALTSGFADMVRRDGPSSVARSGHLESWRIRPMQHAELVAFGVSEHLEGLVVALADVGRGCAEGEESFDFGGRIARAE